MDFELTQDQKAARDFAREAAEREIRPKAIEIDRDHAIPDSVIKKISELGFLGSYFPAEYSGAGLDFLSYALIIEEISKVCGSTGVLISAHTSLGCAPVFQFGSEDQKKKFLDPMARGEKIGCFLLTEPGSGSDVSSLSTTYVKEKGQFRINGSKNFITNGGFKGTGILFATYNRKLKHKGISAFIVDLNSKGVEILKNEDKMGIRGSYTTAFAFDDLMVPEDCLLGAEGEGFHIAMETLNGGRIGIAAQALGIAGGAFERARDYSLQRQQFGRPIADFQAIQFKLAEMAMKIETGRLLTYKAAWQKDQKKDHTLTSAMAKAYTSKSAVSVTDEALQIHGGYGYIVDYEVERMFRDAKITEIYEGTNEIQKLVIAKELLKK
ncbi:MAG: acyl-CoA dehydrogenase family protein [Deltaproteobacteria bacterium]|nr:acyl-CoA dehydrogenase family protein [Deltaproteobacteria bacterium]